MAESAGQATKGSAVSLPTQFDQVASVGVLSPTSNFSASHRGNSNSANFGAVTTHTAVSGSAEIAKSISQAHPGSYTETSAVAEQHAWPSMPAIELGSPRRGLTGIGQQSPRNTLSYEAPVRDDFASWLFDAEEFGDVDFSNPAFALSAAFSHNQTSPSDRQSLLGSTHSLDGPALEKLGLFEHDISEPRRQELLDLARSFRQRQIQKRRCISVGMEILDGELDGDAPNLSLFTLKKCLSAFWDHVSPQIPILHRPTFLPNSCPILLLAAIIALGASTLHKLEEEVYNEEFIAFSDLLASFLRWEIFSEADATAPAKLWVFQALLLLELYEKMFSSRELHERAHIHHASTVTLLKRGTPLIGKEGRESPSGQVPSDEFGGDEAGCSGGNATSSFSWWSQWVTAESMQRVVFMAFIMDITHALMFGHVANISPQEIHLQLPSDDTLWSANTPETVQSLLTSFRLYGIKSMYFLDSLKHCLHGQDVKTHAFGRIILMAGLLSVGWHMHNEETQLTWLKTPLHLNERGRWRSRLSSAFDSWNARLREIWPVSTAASGPTESSLNNSKLDLDNCTALYHLSYLSRTVDFLNCQILSGSRRLVSRRVSGRDYTNAVQSMKEWAPTPQARSAVYNAFKFLHAIFVLPVLGRQSILASYSARRDPLNHRPWIVYYATLTIWAYNYTLEQHADVGSAPADQVAVPSSTGAHHQQTGGQTQRRMSPLTDQAARTVRTFLECGASLEEPESLGHTPIGRAGQCAALCEWVSACLQDAVSEILLEGSQRMKACHDLLVGKE